MGSPIEHNSKRESQGEQWPKQAVQGQDDAQAGNDGGSDYGEEDFEDYDDEFEEDDELPLGDSDNDEGAAAPVVHSKPPAPPVPAIESGTETSPPPTDEVGKEKPAEQAGSESGDSIEEIEEEWSVEGSLDESLGSDNSD